MTFDIFYRDLDEQLVAAAKAFSMRSDPELEAKIKLIRARLIELSTSISQCGADPKDIFLSAADTKKVERIAEKANALAPERKPICVPQKLSFERVATIISIVLQLVQTAQGCKAEQPKAPDFPISVEQYVVDRRDLVADIPKNDENISQNAIVILEDINDCFQHLEIEIPGAIPDRQA